MRRRSRCRRTRRAGPAACFRRPPRGPAARPRLSLVGNEPARRACRRCRFAADAIPRSRGSRSRFHVVAPQPRRLRCARDGSDLRAKARALRLPQVDYRRRHAVLHFWPTPRWTASSVAMALSPAGVCVAIGPVRAIVDRWNELVYHQMFGTIALLLAAAAALFGCFAAALIRMLHGWSPARAAHRRQPALAAAHWVIGALWPSYSVGARGLGAPFWFDLLNKFMVLRTIKRKE